LTAASAAFTPTSMNVAANGNAVGTISFPSLNPNSETAFYVGSPNNTSFNGAENIKIKLKYNNNGVPGSKGYLDNIQLIAKRKLQGYGKQFHFQYDQSSLVLALYHIVF
jgi:phage-related tail fiber protein